MTQLPQPRPRRVDHPIAWPRHEERITLDPPLAIQPRHRLAQELRARRQVLRHVAEVAPELRHPNRPPAARLAHRLEVPLEAGEIVTEAVPVRLDEVDAAA